MVKTIMLGSCVFVQGVFLRALSDGRVAVRVGNQVFEGHPVESKTA